MINFKAAAAYIAVIALAVLYTLFLEAPGGCYLIIALVSAVLISVGLCVYTARKVSAEISISGDLLNRGETAQVSLVLTKTGILPSSFIEAELFSSYHFSTCSAPSLHTAVFGRGSTYFSAEYRAEFFGRGRVGVSAVTARDYLGLISLRINIPKAVTEIKIYPDIPEVDRREGLARSLTDAAAFDESEETTESVFALNGSPGYEHRKYEPGDSLKLINWKLSAKRGEYYVRRLEGAAGAEQHFILDKAGSLNKDIGAARREEQLTVEALLALMMQFAKTELPCSLTVRFGAEWETINIVTPADISEIRYRMTDYTFSQDAVGRLPEPGRGHIVIFSARCDNTVTSLVAGYDERYAAGAYITGRPENVWLILRDEDDVTFIK